MIKFFEEDTSFPLKGKRNISKTFVKDIIKTEGKTEGELSFIFCSDNYLLKMNRDFLDHDYFTDVITFDYVENDVISGDVFISVDMVKRNAEKYAVSFLHELYRVVFHGVLHLCGYGDKTEKEEVVMRGKEDFYLNRNNIV